MNTSISYDRSLVLGSAVSEEKLELLEKISNKQRPIEAAYSEMNEMILLKNKLMSLRDKADNSDIDKTILEDSIKTAESGIIIATEKYTNLSSKNLPEITNLKILLGQKGKSIESPIDYDRSKIKSLPLSENSMKMDVQYFSFNSNGQSSESVMNSIKDFVSANTSFLGNEISYSMTNSVQEQAAHQREVHDIDGILMITANCTHKNVGFLEPCIIDVDSGIRVWNKMVRANQIKNGKIININDYESFKNIAQQSGTDTEASYNIICGKIYGSSFVGMVHVVNESSTASDQDFRAEVESLLAQMEVGSLFYDVNGGSGVSTSFADSVKELLSSKKITSHVSLVTMGIVPTIVSNEVQQSVKQFCDLSPDTTMRQLATLKNNSNIDQASVSAAATNARTGAQMSGIRNTEIKSVISAVGEIDFEKNKVLNINSLMTAFTDYLNKVNSGESGVPITYFNKPITADLLFQMWVEKYSPEKYIKPSGNNSTSIESSSSPTSTFETEQALRFVEDPSSQ